jgi:phospholipid transport system substrate-binding protein
LNKGRYRAVAKYRLFLIGLLIMCVSAPAVGAPDPRVIVDTTIETLREHVIRDQARIEDDPEYAMALIEDLVSPHVDLRLASRLVLGSHWNDATPAQRNAFVDGLQRLLLRVFALHISDYRDAQVDYSPTVYKGDKNQRAVVRTAVSRNGVPPVRVDYRLYRGSDGWKVYDVSVVGISLVKTYRLTIEYDLQKYGLDRVIEQINAKMPLHEVGRLPVGESPPAG